MCGRDKCGDLAKFLVITFNCICVVFGAVLIGAGVWAYTDSQSLAGVLGNIPMDTDQSATEAVDAPSLLERGQWALIVAGGITIIVSIIGCIGACKENKFLLIAFAVIILICLLLELAAAVLVIFFREKLDDVLKDHLFETMEKYEIGLHLGPNDQQISESKHADGDIQEIEEGWDISQVTLECCGVNGYMDWQDNTTSSQKFRDTAKYKGFFCGENVDNSNPKVPLSCCKTKNPNRYPGSVEELYFLNITGCLSNPTEANANLRGCYDEILDKMKLYSLILGIVCAIIGICEMVVVVAACWLACRNRKNVD